MQGEYKRFRLIAVISYVAHKNLVLKVTWSIQ